MPGFSLRSVWHHQQYATLFTWSDSFNSWTTEIRYAWSFAFFAAHWQVLLENADSCESQCSDFLGDASSRSFTFWIISSDIFGRLPVCSSNKLPLVSSFFEKTQMLDLLSGCQPPNFSRNCCRYDYQFCFPVSANNKHLLLQSILIPFPTILCELTHNTNTHKQQTYCVGALSQMTETSREACQAGNRLDSWRTAAPCRNN